jgi:hypothetical protein
MNRPPLEWHYLSATVAIRARPMVALRVRGMVGDFLLTALLGPSGPEGTAHPAPEIGRGPWRLRVLSIREHEQHRYLVRAFETEDHAREWAVCFEHPALVHDADLSFEERARHADRDTGLTDNIEPNAEHSDLTVPSTAEPLSA